MLKFLASSILCIALLVVSAPNLDAQGDLDGRGDLWWSPNSVWMVFNWPNEDELIFVNTEEPLAFCLQPLGDIELDTEMVLSSAAPTATTGQPRKREARRVPSPGRGRLAMLGWSPDSLVAAFRCARDERALFYTGRGVVANRDSSAQPLPWQAALPPSVDFNLITQTGATRYIVRVPQGDGHPARELIFTDLQEVFLLSSVRFGNSTFLSPDGKSLIYPSRSEDGWCLVDAPVREDLRPARRLFVGQERPRLWQMAPQGGDLAVVSKGLVQLGKVDEWDAVRSAPVQSTAVQLSWSPNGQFLAINELTHLWVWGRGEPEPRLVTKDCAQRFWGWRGNQLVFGQASASVANLFGIDPLADTAPRQITRPPRWQTAPRYIALSPDGRKLGCVVNFRDASSRSFWQVWSVELGSGAAWELLLSEREDASRR